MEFLSLLLVVVILIIVLSIRRNLSNELKDVDRKIDELSRLANEIRREQRAGVKTAEVAHAQKTEETITQAHSSPAAQKITIVEEEAKEKPTSVPPPVPVVSEQPTKVAAFQSPTVTPSVSSPVETPRQSPRSPGFFERNPDLEKFIGENLANKIGIAILVIGIGFFVKYAIDQDWINEIGRVFIGIACGGGLLAIAHRMRRTFAAFSSVLVGGGIAVLYFSITIAFHQYQIFSQTAAFVLMVMITGFTVLLALGYNRVELAVLAILGGFGSPFMASTGEGNYIVLFTYILILNGGMLVLAYYKKWRIVNLVCYAFTILLFAGWLSGRFERDNPSMVAGGLIFATLFYLVFFVMNIISNLKQKARFEVAEIMVLLSNTFLYFSAGMYILSDNNATDFRGLFTSLLAVFNFAFAYSLYKNERADRNLVFMLIGLVLTFVSLAAPIQLEGNYITLFWAAETVVLLWLSQKSGIKLMAFASFLVMVLMMISLAMDWNNIYRYTDYSDHLTILLNQGFVTGVVAIASLIIARRLLQNGIPGIAIRLDEYRAAITIAILALLYIVNLLELRYQVIYYVDQFATQTVLVGTYNMFFIATVLLFERRMLLPATMRMALPVLGVIAMASYLFYYHSFVVQARNEYLNDTSGVTGFLFHYLLIGFLVVAAFISLRLLNTNQGFARAVHNGHWWLFIFFFVFVASAELDHTVLLTMNSAATSSAHILQQNHKIGYPILWGIASFLLIAIGLRRMIKMLRIIALVLLLVTLLKLFLIDLRNISEGGKIAAFISLGVLLLVVSFMYQRLKKILLGDGQPDQKTGV